MGRTSRLVLFGAVALCSAAADLVTKDWAASSLARFDHALPVVVEDAMDGKPLADLLAASRFPDAQPKDLQRRGNAVEADPDALFPADSVRSHLGYHIFLSADINEPPLFLWHPGQKELQERGAADFSPEEWIASWSSKKLTWTDLVIEEFPFLERNEIREIFKAGRVHVVQRGLPKLKGATTVGKGDVYLLTGRTIDIVPGFFRFVYAENQGAAWGILNNAPLLVRKIFLQAVSVIAMILLLVVAWRLPQGQGLSALALGLIFGGALGNFVDRFMRYYVVDFIDMYIKSAHWPTYNVADIAISVGVGLLALQIVRKKSPF